ncbi:PREDICTED: caspase-like [Polistes dominula]|uniref:Caspase-like n=1 Tax=Polistes dominula TaxID=743375 RepID=A0ABM1JDJ4_POLDO|nr:PREDICTED: caspase-like [Polistes dominula]
MDETTTGPCTDHCDNAAMKPLNNEIEVTQMYPMRGKKRNLAFIFCHEKFYRNKEKKRIGVVADCNNLIPLLQTFNFAVKIYKDQTRDKILDILSKVAQTVQSDIDCLLIVVMTHGHSGILCAYDEPYDIIDLWSPFSENNCPSLKGKPKLFFIQACRGDDVDAGTELQYEENTQFKQQLSSENSLPDVSVYKLSPMELIKIKLDMLRTPDERDFLIGYSTAPVSFKNKYGSWFIQEICSIFERYGKNYDLLTLLTFVSLSVALNYVSRNEKEPKYHDKKQVPCIINTLTKRLVIGKNGKSNTMSYV